MSFACFVFSIGKNLSYISLGTGPFALGTPLFTGGADSVEKPLHLVSTNKISNIHLLSKSVVYDFQF